MKYYLGKFFLDFGIDGKLKELIYDNTLSMLSNGNKAKVSLGKGRFFTAKGWDECFPTIGPFGEISAMGEIVGKKPKMSKKNSLIKQIWNCGNYIASRTFASKDADGLEMTFAVCNMSEKPLDFLWASHALFSLDGLTEIVLPDSSLLNNFNLDKSVTKFFTSAGKPIVMTIKGANIFLQTTALYWGIWLNLGGWPEKNPANYGCIGIEATNCKSEVPAAILPAKGKFEGKVNIEVKNL